MSRTHSGALRLFPIVSPRRAGIWSTMRKFVITSENNIETHRAKVNKGESETFSFDFSPWTQDNNTVSSVTWAIKSGTGVTISSEALASNVASALIAFSQAGGALIEITATTSAEVFVIVLDIQVLDQQRRIHDYGLCGRGC